MSNPSNLEMCQDFIRSTYNATRVTTLDDLSEGQKVVVVAQVRAQHIRAFEVSGVGNSYNDELGRKCRIIRPSIPGIDGVPYHAIFDYNEGRPDSYLSRGKIVNSMDVDISSEMIRNGQVFAVARLPKDVDEVAEEYAKR
ncbi:hypothetical protein ACFL96_11620 [Thermoproteota archaeon]